jgi:hypothetical protein
MADETNYRAVDVPEQTPPEDYHWTERRAEILQLVEEAGHPRKVNQSRLADRYGVSEAQISKDMGRLRKFIVENIDETRVDSITETVYQKAVSELMDQGEYKDAVKAVESWNDWLMDRGKVEKEPDKHKVDGSGIIIQTESDDGDD